MTTVGQHGARTDQQGARPDQQSARTDPQGVLASGLLSPGALQRAANLQVVVKKETPFLPKVAFTLITLASMAGAVFTGTGLGLTGAPLAARWLTLWSLALAGGFLIWRVVYLHEREADVEPATLDALTSDYLSRANQVGRVVAVVAALGAVGPLVSGYVVGTRPVLAVTLAAGSLVVAALLASGVRGRAVSITTTVVVALLLVGWGIADAGTGVAGLVRVIHLFAFSLWLGGALWNIAVAMPVGRRHPTIGAVLAGAHHLDRFRWVVRFALPTIIVTGLIMADAYRALPTEWWLTFPGVLIPIKVLTIIALVVVFIMCPLFRQCSPVQGVCNVDDLASVGTGAPSGAE
jgi:putative copper resistance protein D